MDSELVKVLIGFMWAAFIISIFVKQEWYFSFDNRFPRLRVFDEIYSSVGKIVFLMIRLIVMFIVLYVLGQIINVVMNPYG